MDQPSRNTADLLAEAERCERLSLFLTEPALLAQLTAWAATYREQAQAAKARELAPRR